MGDSRGQASVELVAALPALLLAAAIALQLFVAGYTLTLADGAAEAGALALASGSPVADAARGALPGWAKDDVAVSVRGGTVTVRLLPPSPLHGVADRLAVTSTASAAVAR
jgi:Flp pilus assembly protein TadG